MQIFAIICLCIILLSIQHLLNWLIRLFFKHDADFAIGTIWISLLGLLISWVCLYYIILWTYPLIK